MVGFNVVLDIGRMLGCFATLNALPDRRIVHVNRLAHEGLNSCFNVCYGKIRNNPFWAVILLFVD